jgi:syntaxin-binding protein 1
MEEKEHTLGEEDKVWVEVRHMHMKDALDKLITDFKSYASEHGHLANGSSLNDMKDMLASLPHLKESKEKVSRLISVHPSQAHQVNFLAVLHYSCLFI